MSTRCTIGQELADGTVRAIYCHHDGYLEYAGRTLLEHWRAPAKVDALMWLGDLSSLGSELGEEHNFNSEEHDHWCLAYARDGGEEKKEALSYVDAEDYRSRSEARHDGYAYLMRKDGSWEVSLRGGPFTSLETALDYLP